MKNAESLNWKMFKDILSANVDLHLQFRYAADKMVNAAYHITELKQAPITSVDCGGVMSTWTEIIVQLWVPDGQQQLRSMKVKKALEIVNLVEKMLPLDPNGNVKIEFGNSDFGTRQMFPNGINVDGDDLVVDLRPDAVQCKAIERGGNCGTTDKADECCASVEKPEFRLNSVISATENCTPGSGCC